MSVIAFDGKMMAADRQMTSGESKYTTTKIFKEGNLIMGFTGTMPTGIALMDWVKNGCQDKFDFNEEYASDILFFNTGTKELWLSNGMTPFRIQDDLFSMGSGADIALAAMKLGKTAKEAVELANEINVFCGMGVDVIYINGEENE